MSYSATGARREEKIMLFGLPYPESMVKNGVHDKLLGKEGEKTMSAAAAKERSLTKTVMLPSGEQVPAFGMGTWHMGDEPSARAEELATLRLGLDLGARLIDTAEMYGEGRA
ncbi:MAG: aldo/keto reductase, partial [Limisphaerales bacterium]